MIPTKVGHAWLLNLSPPLDNKLDNIKLCIVYGAHMVPAHPSIHYPWLSILGMDPAAAHTRQSAPWTCCQCVTGRTHRETICLTCMCLDGGKKLEARIARDNMLTPHRKAQRARRFPQLKWCIQLTNNKL